MTMQQTLEILTKEKKCVEKQNKCMCVQKRCEDCDFWVSPDFLLKAFKAAIQVYENLIEENGKMSSIEIVIRYPQTGEEEIISPSQGRRRTKE